MAVCHQDRQAAMAWFSTLYAAEPDRAPDVVLRSAGPGGLVRERDLAFRRARPTEAAPQHRGGPREGARGR